MKTLETKPWRAKPLSTFRLETPANHPIGSETTLMGGSGGKPEGRRHFGADRFRFENQDNASMSGVDLDNRYQSMSPNKRQD